MGDLLDMYPRWDALILLDEADVLLENGKSVEYWNRMQW